MQQRVTFFKVHRDRFVSISGYLLTFNVYLLGNCCFKSKRKGIRIGQRDTGLAFNYLGVEAESPIYSESVGSWHRQH